SGGGGRVPVRLHRSLKEPTMIYRPLNVPTLLAASGLAVCAAPVLAQDAQSAVGVALARVYPSTLPPPRGGGGTDVTPRPEVTVGEIQGSDSGSSLNLSISPLGTNTTVLGFGLGTTSCNFGNQDVEWEGQCLAAGSNRKPVIPQNMFRLSTVNGAVHFEQIGQ